MKNFGKIVWGSTLGFLIASIALSVLSILLIEGIAATTTSTTGKTAVPENAVLDIDFSKLIIGEQTLEKNPFSNFSATVKGTTVEEPCTVGLLDVAEALKAAAADPKINCLYIRPDMAGGVAHLEEFRAMLEKFRTSGKPIVAYVQTPTNAGYYLASVADRIYISEYHGGMNLLVGLSGSMIYVKDLLDKLGINIQLIRHGKYKSAGEMFIRNTPSQENIEQNTAAIKGIWGEISSKIAAKAGISTAEFNKMIDNLEIVNAEDFVKKGLADECVSLSGMQEKLCTLTGADDFDDVKSISLADYITLNVIPNYKAKEKIAVIYADGEIIDGWGTDQVAGKRFAEMIDNVRDDDDVKAVVLRVNSPGGSVIASSQIKDAVDALRKEKPVIASYGEYAASGGYWISACTDYIFSDATTLTGSIGVFGTIPDFSKTLKNIAHVNIVAVPSNKHSDMFSARRPLNAEEVEYIQKDIEAIYSSFTGIVAEGRKMDVSKVDELGQGRVWTGVDALKRGLVDKIGGLADALEYTAGVAGCTDYCVVSYPEPPTAMQMLMEAFEPAQNDHLVKMFSEIREMKDAKVFARLPYTMEIR